MLLLTAAMFAVAATAPDAEIEKKLPTEIQQFQMVEEESEELALNDEIVLEEVDPLTDEE